MIIFTQHALEKFDVLKRHGFPVSEEQVLATIADPQKIDYSRSPLLIAQRKIDSAHLLRVVYRKEGNRRIIITFYPGRTRKYP